MEGVTLYDLESQQYLPPEGRLGRYHPGQTMPGGSSPSWWKRHRDTLIQAGLAAGWNAIAGYGARKRRYKEQAWTPNTKRIKLRRQEDEGRNLNEIAKEEIRKSKYDKWHRKYIANRWRNVRRRIRYDPMPRSHNVNMPGIGTVQKDVKSIYRRKRRRKLSRKYRRYKKRARRLTNKIRNTIYKDLGEFNYNANYTLAFTSADSQQEINWLALGGFCGDPGRGQQDIRKCVESIRNTLPQAQLIGGVSSVVYQQNMAVRMRKMVMDLTITNTGLNAIELDIYECIVRKDILYEQYSNLFNSLIANSQTALNTAGTAELTALTATTIGTTPFDVPLLGRYIKILKANRVYLEVGKSMSMIRKGKYRKQITQNMFESDAAAQLRHCGLKGCTRFIVFRYNGVPSASLATTASAFRVQMTNHYSFNVLQNQQNYDSLI